MAMDIKEIMSIIPHRQPFLLIDTVEEVEPGVRAVAKKNVTFNEPYFAGHFPGNPVMPGVLIIEALAQTGRDRIRPILMTAMTTIFGLATMALGLGAGGDMLQPLAIVTIGGLAYATLLTLFIVPAIYDIFLKKDPKKVVIEEVEEV